MTENNSNKVIEPHFEQLKTAVTQSVAFSSPKQVLKFVQVILDQFEIPKTKQLTIVCGMLCSGKGTYCKQYSDMVADHLVTSDIVKRVTNATTRSQLSQTANKDIEIIEAIKQQIHVSFQKKMVVVLEGIRQPSILTALLEYYKNTHIDVDLVWLSVPEQVRKMRFKNRKADKDDVPFEQAEQGDIQLGIIDLYEQYKYQFKIVTNYNKEEHTKATTQSN